MTALRKYLDANEVILLVHPDHILNVVVTRDSPEDPVFTATFTLTDGGQFVMVDHDMDRLCHRAQVGDQ